MPDRQLLDAIPSEGPSHQDVQQLVEAETGRGDQGVLRTWQASDSDRIVLTSDSTGVKISRDNGATAPTHVVNDGTPAGGSLAGTYPSPTLAVSTVDALIPPGTIWAYGGTAAPAGWLLCDGTIYATATYPKLFAALGYAYGGSGATFGVPDLRGRVVLGVSATPPHSRGQLGGAEAVPGPLHTHPGTHSHDLNSHTHAQTQHTHAQTATHSHGLTASHSHSLSSHTHGMTNHDHTLNGHTHGAAALGIGGLMGVESNAASIGAGSGGQNVADDNHTHGLGTLDVNGTTDAASGSTSGATNYSGGSATSGTPSVTDTGFPISGSTATAAAGTTDTSAVVTTGAPQAPATSTATDATSPAASFAPPTLPTMMPFQVAMSIIKTGA
jgi:hypothetical protein